jgi:hypothetical protein
MRAHFTDCRACPRIGCIAELAGRQMRAHVIMRAHFTICPKRPAGSEHSGSGGNLARFTVRTELPTKGLVSMTPLSKA